MKKILIIEAALLLTVLTLFIYKSKSQTKHIIFSKVDFSCGAPTGLNAYLTGSQTIIMTWDAVPGATSYSYGGYYNRTGPNPPYVINFGGNTASLQASVQTVNTFTSGTFQVTSHCPDGSSATSVPKSF